MSPAGRLLGGPRIATRVASTPDERDAVARLRYQVYVAELGKASLPHADHEHERLADPEDERSGSYLHYVTVDDEVVGTLRADAYPAGEVPPAVADRFGLDTLPELAGEGVSEIARFVVDRSHRGSRAALALGLATYRHGAVERGYRVSFSMAAPGLVPSYRRFGFQPYAAPPVATADGLRVPLVAVWSDARRLARLGSPIAAVAARHFGPGRRPALDTAPFDDRLDERASPLRSSAPLVRAELDRLAATSPPLLDGVSSRGLRWLSREAMVLDAAAGDLLVRRGLVDRELYVVLAGALEVNLDGAEPVTVGPGEPVGELALFSGDGRRSADVTVSDDATLLVLRRRAIERMLDDVPAAGARFVVNLARCMADRAVRHRSV